MNTGDNWQRYKASNIGKSAITLYCLIALLKIIYFQNSQLNFEYGQRSRSDLPARQVLGCGSKVSGAISGSCFSKLIYCDSDSSSADIKHNAKTCKADSKELL